MSTVVREYGQVKLYNPSKGFGFIRRAKGRDVFFFYQDFVRPDVFLVEGDYVSFEVELSPRGPRARALCKEG